MPQSVSQTFARPQGFGDLTKEASVELVTSTLELKEHTAAGIRHVALKSVMGVQAILAQRWQASPFTKEPRRQMSPTIAARNKWARAEALQRKREFLKEYADALAAFLAGALGALFPAGTWAMRRFVVITPNIGVGALDPAPS